MTIQLADGRKTFLDFREKAPLAATANMYLDKDGNVVKGASTTGHLAVGVPGTVSGMEMALAKYGTMKRTAVIAPAIRYAQDGFVLDQGDVDMLHTATDDFKKDAATGAVFLNKGEEGFYKGTVGAAIVASSLAGKGILTQADLDQYKARELKPVECDYRGFHVVSAPPPSSGGVIICEILNVLEGYPLKDLGFRSAQAVHYQIHALLDRRQVGQRGLGHLHAERLVRRQGHCAEDRRDSE